MASELNFDPVKVVEIDYTNHRGERALRRIVPEYLWWGFTAWHPEMGWLLHAYDIEKGAYRDFSWHGIEITRGDENGARETILAAVPMSDPKEKASSLLTRCQRALDFHEHLLKEGQPQLARDFIDMGMFPDDALPGEKLA